MAATAPRGRPFSHHWFRKPIFRRQWLASFLRFSQSPFFVLLLGLTIYLFMLLRIASVQASLERETKSLGQANSAVVVFYNIYVPAKPTLFRRALVMIQDQLDQISQSHETKASASQKLVVHYTTIGQRTLSTTRMHSYCHDRGILCLSQGHYPQGYEEVTLQSVYEYCEKTQSPSEHEDNRIVVYLHSKGTYHQNPENQSWRRHLTAAALSRECRNALEGANECNVCGLQFYPIWTMFYPGNMWAASCSYVRQLLPPKSFAGRMAELHAARVRLHRNGTLTSRLYPDYFQEAGYQGVDRYAAEHWVGSHPNIRPCDLSVTTDLLVWRTPEGAATSLAAAPRQPLQTDWYRLNASTVDEVVRENRNRPTEVSLLLGLKVKWRTLYGTMPQADSWIWDYFPSADTTMSARDAT